MPRVLAPRHALGARELLIALLWGVYPVAVGVAAGGMPPLLQATASSSISLFLLWLWTRWRLIGVFAQDETLLPGALLGVLFAVRLGLLYLAVARSSAALAALLAFGAVALLQAVSGWRDAPRAAAAALLLTALAIGVGLPLCDDATAAAALGAGLLWAGEARLTRHPRLAHCGGTRFIFYQLIGAAVVLPVASVVAGENWLVIPAPLVWGALAAQVLAGGVGMRLMWLDAASADGASAPRTHPLQALSRVAPLACALLQGAVGTMPPLQVLLGCVLLSAATWLLGRTPTRSRAAP